MIELFEGVPGSGKSYWAVKDRFLPEIDKGRRIYIYVDGIYLDRLSWFKGLALDELKTQITVWKDASDVMAMHATVEPMSRVIIDEAQTVFRAMERVPKGLLRWLETHRHHGVDVLMCCQDFMQMSASVTRLVESTTKFRRLWALGFDRRCQAKVRGTPTEPETIRAFTFKYEPRIYQYYSSYSAAAIKEEKRVHSIWKSPTVLLGGGAAVFALCVFMWRPWTSLGAPAGRSEPLPTAQAVQPSIVGPSRPAPPVGPGTVSVQEIRIVGTIQYEDGPNGEKVWRYMLANGEVLTSAEIAGKFGVPVVEKKRGHFMVLEGQGVVYGAGGD